jgi:ribosomal protein S18 acetylase RimI-like enzyme
MDTLIRPLRPEDARQVAEIHAEGQPGTFLTSLGQAFLRALYAEMATSPQCYGFVAVQEGVVVGVVTGTVDASTVFKDLVLRRGYRLVLPVAGSVLRHPSLIPKIAQTFLYPSKIKSQAGEAELFFIGTRVRLRGQGLGQRLFQALADESRRRGMTTMGLTVDDSNETAKRFYQHRGMHPDYTFALYNRRMHWYVLPLAHEDEDDDNPSDR